MPGPHAAGSVARRAARLRGGRRLAIEDVMTPQPVTIGRGQSLAVAHAMMREHGVRHLPVLEHGDLVGLVSLRDLYYLESFAGVDVARDRVEDAMTIETYAVGPDAPLERVAAYMAEHRLDCAVVMERGRVAGIFTASDAMRVLARVLGG